VLQLAERYPTLPEPATGLPVTEVEQLSPKVRDELRNKLGVLKQRYKASLGKWPEFALAIARDQKDPRPALGDKPLGPCAPGEFAQPVNEFLKDELIPKLSTVEARRLDALKGRWPEYPKQMIESAKAKDLSVPGVTLPGKPSLWAKYYRYTPTAGEGPGEN
jgi:hypothetical protein